MLEQWTLPNGLRVVGEQLPWIRSVTVGVWNHVGPLMERPGENGLSHFIEHMVFKGTARRTGRQIAQEMDAVGGELNAYTARDHTCFYARVIDEDLPLAVDMLADLVLGASFDPGELEKERGVVLEEIAAAADDPEDLVGELTNRAQYGDGPAGQPILGTAGKVGAYAREDLVAYRGLHYSPKRAVVGICGSYDRERAAELIERHFGGWRSGPEDVHPAKIEPACGVKLAAERDNEQLQLSLGWPGVLPDDDLAVAQSIMATVLGGAMSSRLWQRIREELGMAYTVAAYSAACEASGAFRIYAGVSPKNARRVLDEIGRECRRFMDGGITERELKETKNQMRVGYLMGLESPSARLFHMGKSLLLRGSVRSQEERLAEIARVTADDVAEAARRSLGCAPCLAAVGRQAERVREARP